MALTQIVTTDSVSASVVNTKIVDKANADISGLQIAQTAGGTATAITLTGVELTNGYQKTFIISASNSGAATTVNGKPLYKPGGKVAPNLVAGKAATVWYNLAGDCFFYKASAEGTATAGDVLAGKTFSNDDDTGLIGTLALTGNAVVGDILATKTAYLTDPKTKVTGTMVNRGAVTITPGTSNQAIAAGYHNGSGYVAGDSDLVAANILAGVNIFNVAGSAKRSATGTGSTPASGGLISVSGLGFTPKKIILFQWRTSQPTTLYMKIYCADVNNANFNNYLTHYVTTAGSPPQDTGAWTVGDGYFSTVVYNLGWDDVVYQYFAFE